MKALRSARHLLFLTIALLAMVIPVGSTSALAQEPDFATFPAGLACTFELGFRYESEGNRIDREFYDKDGNLVRFLSTGTGGDLTIKNMSTGETLTLNGNGSNADVRINPDGTQRVALTGNTILILFPTDIPAGPSTTLYSGRVVYTVDADGIYTLIQASGKSTDICAALSS